MKFTICGSAAAETIPALFCTCKTCQQAHENGGKDLRSRAAYQLGEKVRIDWGPDSAAHGRNLGIHFEKLKHLLMTHSHEDHLYIPDIAYRRKGFSDIGENNILTIYGNEKVKEKLHDHLNNNLEKYGLRFELVEPYKPFELKDVGLKIAAVYADHAPDQIPLNYIIGHNDKWLFQGNDTGFPKEQTWEFFKNYKFDVVILDSTCGENDKAYSGHMGCKAVVETFEKLEAQGSLADGCKRIATHFSHNGHMTHKQLEDYFAPHGIVPAYDGMAVEI